MKIDTEALLALSPAEKLRIVELLWDDLGESNDPLPIPEAADREASRRRDEMLADSALGLDAEQVWQRIDARKR
jgi:putative addiction module component (TIGR02574 family)